MRKFTYYERICDVIVLDLSDSLHSGKFPNGLSVVKINCFTNIPVTTVWSLKDESQLINMLSESCFITCHIILGVIENVTNSSILSELSTVNKTLRYNTCIYKITKLQHNKKLINTDIKAKVGLKMKINYKKNLPKYYVEN